MDIDAFIAGLKTRAGDLEAKAKAAAAQGVLVAESDVQKASTAIEKELAELEAKLSGQPASS